MVACAVRNKRARLNVHTRGGAGTSRGLLGPGKGITSRAPMLRPDASRSLAERSAMCGHELEKVPVPFGQLDSFAALRRRTFSWVLRDLSD